MIKGRVEEKTTRSVRFGTETEGTREMASKTIVQLVIAYGVFAIAASLSHYQRYAGSGQNNLLDHSILVREASCPEKNGRFPIPSQCDAYIECVDGVPEEKLCPEGLLFNPEARFNYPCGYPIDVNCGSRSSRQPAKPTEDCPHQYGYFKIGDSKHCGQFMNCAEGKGYVFDCPEGLAFNPQSYRCDWPDQVSDCDAESYLGFQCPKEKEGDSFGIKFYRSNNDCQHYYVCVNGRPRLQSCGVGNAFNELIDACDAAENVTGCEPPEGTLLNKKLKLV